MSANLTAMEDLNWDEALRERFESFCSRFGWSSAQISRDLQRHYTKATDRSKRPKNVGLGESTLYNYRTGKWSGSQESLERLEGRLRGWLDFRLGATQEEHIIDTAAARLISKGLKEASMSRQFVTVISHSGMGKTLLARHYANAQRKGAEVAIVECYDGMTPKALIAAICRAIGKEDHGNIDALLSRAKTSLSEEHRMLIIDEANFLTHRSLNHLVYVWNTVRNGIVLLGTHELDKTVQSSELQRVASRHKLRVYLPMTLDDEIKARLEEAFPEEVTARAIEMAKRGSFGRLRDLDTLISSALNLRDKLAEKNITRSAEDLLEKVCGRDARYEEPRKRQLKPVGGAQ